MKDIRKKTIRCTFDATIVTIETWYGSALCMYVIHVERMKNEESQYGDPSNQLALSAKIQTSI